MTNWQIVGAVASVFVAVEGAAGVAFLWTSVDLNKKALAESAAASERAAAALTAIQDAIKAQGASKPVALSDTLNNCYADNTGVTCTVTNVATEPVSTCVQGSITRKEAQGVHLLSLPICTGRLLPRETRTYQAPWVGGFARDVCSSKESIVGLDWKVCVFATEPWEPKAK